MNILKLFVKTTSFAKKSAVSVRCKMNNMPIKIKTFEVPHNMTFLPTSQSLIMKTYSLIFTIIICSLSLNTAFADFAPTFHNNTLTIPSVDSTDQPGLYQDAIFGFTEQGEWLLLDYINGQLLNISKEENLGIEKVEIIKTETFPVQIFLKVTATLLSENLFGQIRYKLINNKFEIFMYYSNVPCVCTSDIGTTFTKIVPLNVYSLKKGEFEYSVNGNFTGVFSLTEDNEL